MVSVILLGAGNVASHLFEAFYNAENISVTQWYNRSLKKLSSYKNKVEITDDLKNLKAANIYILAVSDDAIAELSKQLPLKDQFVVHTSGSVNVYDLDKKHKRGVFYPLQTFSKDTSMDFANVPICIETINKSDYHILKE